MNQGTTQNKGSCIFLSLVNGDEQSVLKTLGEINSKYGLTPWVMGKSFQGLFVSKSGKVFDNQSIYFEATCPSFETMKQVADEMRARLDVPEALVFTSSINCGQLV